MAINGGKIKLTIFAVDIKYKAAQVYFLAFQSNRHIHTTSLVRLWCYTGQFIVNHRYTLESLLKALPAHLWPITAVACQQLYWSLLGCYDVHNYTGKINKVINVLTPLMIDDIIITVESNHLEFEPYIEAECSPNPSLC